MCGIVGYIGPKNGVQIGLNGLKRLLYRGYDSCGISVINNGELFYYKTKGKIDLLENYLKKNPLEGRLLILQNRWATHGEPNEVNAHPHFDSGKKIALVHNGIIENYRTLKE